jgi:hypothetical protein
MKTLLLAAATTLSLSMGVAYADGGGTGPTMFTAIEAQLRPKPAATVHITQPGGAPTYVYSTRQSQGTWLFAPNPNDGGANN